MTKPLPKARPDIAPAAKVLLAALLPVLGSAAAQAQTAAPAATTVAAPAATATTDAAAARMLYLEAKIEALEKQVATLTKDSTAAKPTWRASPEFKSSGWAFKANGEFQYDFSYVENPDNRINTVNLGYNGRARRLIIGFQGDMPGSIKYKMELNFAQAQVDYEDIWLAWEPTDSILSAKIGFYYPFVSLENLTSNKLSSFVERAQMNDAWASNRRIGASIGLANRAGNFRFDAGMFNGNITSSFANTDWSASARGVYYPKALGGQLHMAANYQYRRTAVQNQSFTYQARPFTQSTNVRFVGTGPATSTGTIASGIAVHGDQVLGAELAGIWGPLHVASEAQYVLVDALQPGDVLPPGQTTTGQRLLTDPAFFSVYGEAGYWFTGETRGYRNGRFDRTRILDPIDKGGSGGFQLVGRIDYLNLTKYVGGVGNGIVNGTLNGGQQTGYLLALNWWPTDYIRFTSQYTRAQITGGPSAGQVVPVSLQPLYDRSYGVDLVVARAQLDF